MQIKMVKDATGAPDGIHIYEYVAGDVYAVPDVLGEALIKAGSAKLDESKNGTGPLENK